MSNDNFPEIKPFNDHGSGCSGHANYMLDCTYTKKEDRELIIKCLDNYIPKEKKSLVNNSKQEEKENG